MSENERFLSAYYFDFDPTGCDSVDDILEAVAVAGKAAPHTADWLDPLEEDYRGIKAGVPLAANIQHIAVESATRIAALEAELAEAKALLELADDCSGCDEPDPMNGALLCRIFQVPQGWAERRDILLNYKETTDD